MSRYILDSNFFIQAHRSIYPLDVVQSFWLKVKKLSEDGTIVSWANSMSHHYAANAIQDFLETDLADPWLVAFAMSNNWTIVTYEKSEPNRKNRIKIPEVCNKFNIRYINTIEMLRELKENF